MKTETRVVLWREFRKHIDWHGCQDINGNKVDFRGPAEQPGETDELCPVHLALAEVLAAP